MCGPMVRATLDGSKTQTRRVVKPQPEYEPRCWSHAANCWLVGDSDQLACPFGIAGDALWVRETWRCFGGREYEYQHHQPSIRYRADAPAVDAVSCDWRPSIFMPRWACRIVLEITSVRVERVASISEADAMAEGIIKQVVTVGRAHGRPDYDMFALRPGDHCEWECTAREVYRKLWDSLNAKRGYGWATNPWVWVITFQRKKGTEAGL